MTYCDEFGVALKMRIYAVFLLEAGFKFGSPLEIIYKANVLPLGKIDPYFGNFSIWFTTVHQDKRIRMQTLSIFFRNFDPQFAKLDL